MIRVITRPSTALCTLAMYIAFLLSEPKSASCRRLAEVMNISHDSVNRFLQREAYTPSDLFNESKVGLNLIGGVLSVDDSVLDKPHSYHMDLVGYFWSGKHHAVVKGIVNIRPTHHTPKNTPFFGVMVYKDKLEKFGSYLLSTGKTPTKAELAST